MVDQVYMYIHLPVGQERKALHIVCGYRCTRMSIILHVSLALGGKDLGQAQGVCGSSGMQARTLNISPVIGQTVGVS